MKVEVLYFDGCPTYKTAENTLREVLAEGSEERLRFPGSPTIRVGGEDLFPVFEREDWRLGCRVYATPEGLKGSPTAEMLREALTKEAAADATLHR